MGQAVTWQGKEIQSFRENMLKAEIEEKEKYVCGPVREHAVGGNSGKEKYTVPLRE